MKYLLPLSKPEHAATSAIVYLLASNNTLRATALLPLHFHFWRNDVEVYRDQQAHDYHKMDVRELLRAVRVNKCLADIVAGALHVSADPGSNVCLFLQQCSSMSSFSAEVPPALSRHRAGSALYCTRCKCIILGV